MNRPEISIIIPVFNVEKYLAQCIDSVVNQTFRNLEVILVDDGSSDNSPYICEEYAKRDSRIKVIHQENKGASIARNVGIKESTGKFLMFLDSDDWLDLNTCVVTYDTAIKNSADVVLWPYIRAFDGKYRKKNIFNESIIIFDELKVKSILQRRMVGLLSDELAMPENADALVPVCMKLYKTDIVKHNMIEFVDIKKIGTSEDAIFNLQVFEYVRKAVYINRHFYYYRRDNQSSVTTQNKPQLYEQWNYLFDLIERYIQEKRLGLDYIKSLNNRIALSIIGLGFNELNSEGSHSNKIKRIKRIIGSDRYKKAYKMLETKYFPIHWKVFFTFAKMNSASLIYIILVLMKKVRRRK